MQAYKKEQAKEEYALKCFTFGRSLKRDVSAPQINNA